MERSREGPILVRVSKRIQASSVPQEKERRRRISTKSKYAQLYWTKGECARQTAWCRKAKTTLPASKPVKVLNCLTLYLLLHPPAATKYKQYASLNAGEAAASTPAPAAAVERPKRRGVPLFGGMTGPALTTTQRRRLGNSCADLTNDPQAPTVPATSSLPLSSVTDTAISSCIQEELPVRSLLAAQEKVAKDRDTLGRPTAELCPAAVDPAALVAMGCGATLAALPISPRCPNLEFCMTFSTTRSNSQPMRLS